MDLGWMLSVLSQVVTDSYGKGDNRLLGTVSFRGCVSFYASEKIWVIQSSAV